MKIVEPIMGVARSNLPVATETVTIDAFAAGLPARTARRPDRVELILAANAIGGATAASSRSSRESRHRGEEQRILRGAGMALLHIGYERLLSAIHNEAMLERADRGPAARHAALRGPLVRRSALMLRDRCSAGSPRR